MAPAASPSRPLQPWCSPVSKPAQPSLSDQGIADPTTETFWQACLEHRLVVQKCDLCGRHQFYPRPFCLACEATTLGWVEARGTGTIYSLTTVRLPVTEELPPPYLLALVDLDEGPRLLTNIDAQKASIGDKVRVAWRERSSLPPNSCIPIGMSSVRPYLTLGAWHSPYHFGILGPTRRICEPVNHFRRSVSRTSIGYGTGDADRIAGLRDVCERERYARHQVAPRHICLVGQKKCPHRRPHCDLC